MNFETFSCSKEVSGFSLDEKNKIYEILINYGMPSNDLEEHKDDFELLRALLNKHMKLEDKVPDKNADSIKTYERFISQLHIVSQKILKDY